MRYWEEVIDFIERYCGPKEPFCLTVVFKCNFTQEVLNEEYTGFYTPVQMMNHPLYDQISYKSSHSDAFKFKLGHDVKLFLVEMKAVRGKDIAEHVMIPAKVIPASLVTFSYAHGLLRYN